MTTTPTGSPEAGPGEGRGNASNDDGPRVTRDEVRDLGRLRRTTRRSPEGRHVAGVAGGLARHLDVDPVLVRVALVVLTFLGGAGLVVYAAGWLFIPEEGTGDSTIRLDARSRAVAVYLALGIALLAVIGDTFGDFETGWALFPVVVVALIWAAARDRWDLGRDDEPDARDDSPARGPVDLTKPGAGAGTYAAPGAQNPVRAPERRRGPVLFWFTLCLVALALGTLGIVEGAGADVAAPAYPALALGIVGAMLVLGSFWGRAGGLILLGLLSSAGLAAAVAADQFPEERIELTPTSAAALPDDYAFGAGELVVDLTAIDDLSDLEGRTLELDGDVGRIEVVVPAGLGVEGVLTVEGPGHVQAFDAEQGGIDSRLEFAEAAPGSSAYLTIDADLSVGDVTVRSE